MSQTQQHFDKIAGRYKKAADSWESVYRKAREVIEPEVTGKLVLDIGSGGYFPYDTRLPSKVTALDISPAMLDKITDLHIEKIVGDARSLENVPDNSFDVVLFALSVHHINGHSVRESLSVLDCLIVASQKKLKKGGKLILMEPTLARPLFFLEEVFFSLIYLFLALFKVSMIFFYSPDQLKRHLAGGFGIPETQVEVISLPIQGFIDPLGGSFPGLLRIPAWLCPTRYYLFLAKKFA